MPFIRNGQERLREERAKDGEKDFGIRNYDRKDRDRS